MRMLDVYLHENLTGQLIQDDSGSMVFEYSASWLEHKNAMPLSNSLPLRAERFSAKECRGFFAGILPEEDKRRILAKNLGISDRNDYAMLEQIGGECAGGITFIPSGQTLPDKQYAYKDLNDEELAEILRVLPRRPLMAGEHGVRLSLAGAQDKISVCIEGGKISLPLGGAPSTHIIKPAIKDMEGTVTNEFICMSLAKTIGLNCANVTKGSVEDISYLMIERYDRDRIVTPNGGIYYMRLHQEDFCQAMGFTPEHKYQGVDGGPSLKECFQLLRDISTLPVADLDAMLNAIIFNYIIGNNDAHGKNFSLIYNQDFGGLARALSGQPEYSVRLAPLYDLICTAYYPELSARMAMKIGGEYEFKNITSHNFEKFAEEVGMSKPLVLKRVKEIADKILTAIEGMSVANKTEEDVLGFIKERCKSVLQSQI